MQPLFFARPSKMSTQSYLIDTNVIIGLEDNHTVQPFFAALLSIAAKHKVDVMVHEVARDDIQRDKDTARRNISLSKLDKFQILRKVRGLDPAKLDARFGRLDRPNDVVDAILLDSIERGAADFLITEDVACTSERAGSLPHSGAVSCLSLMRSNFSGRLTSLSKLQSATWRSSAPTKFS